MTMDYPSLIRHLVNAEKDINKALGDAVAVKNTVLHGKLYDLWTQIKMLEVDAMLAAVK
jgi:hypothetical protein